MNVRKRELWPAVLLVPALCMAQAGGGYTIATVAGNGTRGFAGDGGSAVDASLNYPQGIAFDRSGNLYIADCFNHRVRRLSPSGTITTVAGTGEAGYSGDSAPA